MCTYMEACTCINMCKYAHMLICSYVSIDFYASMQVCMYSSMQACKYARMQGFNYNYDYDYDYVYADAYDNQHNHITMHHAFLYSYSRPRFGQYQSIRGQKTMLQEGMMHSCVT